MWAARGGNIRVLKYLIEAGSDVTLRDRFGKSMMLCGAFGGSVRVVEHLIHACGQDVHDLNTQGWNAFAWAVLKNHERLALHLVAKYGVATDLLDRDQKNALLLCAERGHAPLLAVLLREFPGLSLAQRDSKGNTALHLAVVRAGVDCIDLIMGTGAVDYAATNDAGYTAAEAARLKDRPDIAARIEAHPTSAFFAVSWMLASM